MIIHITGVSGSGKTTLGEKLSSIKNTIVIDSDDIDDESALKILNNKKYDYLLTPKNLNKFWKLKGSLNEQYLKKLFKTLDKTPDKNLIIVGHTFGNNPKTDPANYANYKYFIDSNPEIVFKRLNARNIDVICKHNSAIKKLFKTENNPVYVDMLLLYRYKIRVPFVAAIQDIIRHYNFMVQKSRKQKYKIMTSTEIFDEVKNLLKNA